MVEKSLELVGATAIEDKLQELRIPGPGGDCWANHPSMGMALGG